MAGKKKKGRRSLHIFGLTLILTVALGSALLLGGWALGGFGNPQLAAVQLESQLLELISEVSVSYTHLGSQRQCPAASRRSPDLRQDSR